MIQDMKNRLSSRPTSGGDNRPADRTAKATANRRRNLGLQLQFQLALGVLFLLFSLVAAFLIYTHEKRLLEENALRKSHLVMAAVESTRAYVRDTLRPRMSAELGPDGFLLEAMSTSYITRAVMDRFKETLPEYRYRRVAVNARNPASEPTPSEWELIRFFRKNPEAGRWRGMRDVQGDVAFVHARPVRMAPSCLACHGAVADAPAAMVAQYGAERGFGYAENELAGVMAVSVPVRLALEQIRGRALSVFWVTLLLLVFLYVLILFLFNRMVIRSLRGLLSIFRQGLVGEEEERLLATASEKVEIDELADAAQDLTRHLAAARRKVARHAQELERRVADRTRELEISRARLRGKVETRNRELATLNRIAERITRSPRLEEILPEVLDQTLRLIPADGAAIYLLRGEGPARNLNLECRRNADKLSPVVAVRADEPPGAVPASLTEALHIAAGGAMSQFACKRNRNCLNVPLICRDRVLGVMTFVGMDSPIDTADPPAEMNALLMSIGQQIGITVESLQNMNAVVQAKEVLQSVFDGIPDIMVLLDREGRIRMVNRAYLKRHDIALEAALGKICKAMEDGCPCPLAGRELRRALESREETREEIRTPAGEIFRIYHYPILDEAGEIWGVLRYAKDITLEKQVEQRIQQTEKLAALGQLGAGVAHEINNPMGIILCYTDLIRRQLSDDDPAGNDLAVIEKQARNCQRIVGDLLNFARGPAAERRMENVNTAVAEVADMVRPQFRKRGAELALALNDAVPPVPMDIDRMKQVFLNLMMNAQQAIGDAGGTIRVETAWACTDRRRADCDPGEEVVKIIVTDDGGGIPPEVVEKIFDPFFSTKQTGEGTGLGLSVSYGIVKDHGGDIGVKSEPGQGARFTVRLPVSSREGGAP